MNRPHSKIYQRIFVAENGPGPWQCSDCHRLVYKFGRRADEGNVHHIDEDFTNQDPANLALLCQSCHRRHHAFGMSDETREKLRAAATGQSPSAETRAKQSAALKGKERPTKVRSLISERSRGPRERVVCEDCGNSYTRSWLTRHKEEEGRCDSPIR